jgi:hypothetical protein
MPETQPCLSFSFPLSIAKSEDNQNGGAAVYALSPWRKKANASRENRFALPFMTFLELNASDKTTFADQIKGCLDFEWCGTFIPHETDAVIIAYKKS